MSGIEFIRRAAGLHQAIADGNPKLRRGMVWCHRCGHSEKINSADCLRNGWPLHCRETMSIDSPEERERMRAPRS